MISRPPWLAELYRQWHAARGRRIAATSRAFTRDWAKLMEDAGLASAEDQATAAREAEAIEKAGHLVIKRHRYRIYLIERITLPLDQELWLRGLFGEDSAQSLQEQSLAIVAEFSQTPHPRFPVEWEALCQALSEAFLAGRSLRPFQWSHPEALRRLLDVVWKLSERECPVGTPVRAASVDAGLDSKGLERHQRSYESALSRLFGSGTSFRDLGFVSGDSYVELHGPVCLHFPDGSSHDFAGLSNVLISATDLARCSRISTTATRLLSIENRKTTFRQFSAANGEKRVLLTTSSFPSPAFREMLEKLPPDLPHQHFGDTDPAGWHILLKLREATPRPVKPFRMKWRPAAKPSPLTSYDRQLLPKLLENPLLTDVRDEIALILQHEDRGDYEQETLPLLFPKW